MNDVVGYRLSNVSNFTDLVSKGSYFDRDIFEYSRCLSPSICSQASDMYKPWRFVTSSAIRVSSAQLPRCHQLQFMSSVTPQRYDNDSPQPHLVIATPYNLYALAYLPDERRVVTGCEDGIVTVWNLENGGREGAPMQHENGIYSLAVTRDGNKIISNTGNGSVKVWDNESYQLVKEWTHSEWLSRITISPDD